MVELHKLVIGAMKDVIKEHEQEQILTQLSNLFENVLTDNYDKTDVNLLIDKIKIPAKEGEGE